MIFIERLVKSLEYIWNRFFVLIIRQFQVTVILFSSSYVYYCTNTVITILMKFKTVHIFETLRKIRRFSIRQNDKLPEETANAPIPEVVSTQTEIYRPLNSENFS